MTTNAIPDPNQEDERLIHLVQAGDLDAFNQIVIRHQRSVYSVCLRMLRDPAQAEDVTQEAFIRAWNAVGSFKGGLVRPWLLRIATNRTYDVLRAQSRRPAQSLDAQLFESEPEWTSQAPAAEHPESYAARSELSAWLEGALGSLPDDQRLAIILSDIQGYSYDDIAAVMDVAVGTVKSRISRGRSRLRDLLHERNLAGELPERFARFDTERPSAG
ncbi:MAG TPA: sigma-70 family RNA polymerase sigma factor [Thermomicrobiales bacterium]|nr:sigma-70 family RNA polymerase sigma factor [Thermomicrobiales bacterium]